VGVAAVHREDDVQGAVQGRGALLQTVDQLLLAFLVEKQLVVVAHTHAYEPFTQLVTESKKWHEEIRHCEL